MLYFTRVNMLKQGSLFFGRNESLTDLIYIKYFGHSYIFVQSPCLYAYKILHTEYVDMLMIYLRPISHMPIFRSTFVTGIKQNINMYVYNSSNSTVPPKRKILNESCSFFESLLHVIMAELAACSAVTPQLPYCQWNRTELKTRKLGRLRLA